MSDRRIVITGGCGFLGQHLVRHLVDSGCTSEIVLLDLRKPAAPLYDFTDQPKVSLQLGCDIQDIQTTSEALEGADLVIHLAGVVSLSLKDKELLDRVNRFGTFSVLRAARKAGAKRVIHISSVAALGYKDDSRHPIDESFEFDWRIAYRCRKYYMLSKHDADVEVLRARRDGLPVVVLYPGLMFGPGDVTNSSRLIRAIEQRRIPFNMPGGTNVVDVRDVAAGIVATIERELTEGDFLLSGHNLSFTECNRLIADALGVSPPRRTLPRMACAALAKVLLAAEWLSKRKIELTADNVDSAAKFRYFDNSRARHALGWQPAISFEQTIRDTIEWMNRHGVAEE